MVLGAVSTHYHVLSPISRQFIRRAICISGTAFLFYSYLDSDNHLNRMYKFANQINATINDLDELKRFLQTVDASKIIEFTSQTTFDDTLTFFWAPVIERKNHNFRFLFLFYRITIGLFFFFKQIKQPVDRFF